MKTRHVCARCRLFVVASDGALCELCQRRTCREAGFAKLRTKRAEASIWVGSTRLRNTEQGLIDMIKKTPGLTTPHIVRRFYPETRQPHKKYRTFERALRRLERLALVRMINDGWYTTRTSGHSSGGRAA